MKLFQSKTRKLFAGFFAFGLTLSIVSAGIFSLVQPAWAQDVLSTGQAALEATSSQTPTAGTSVSAGNPAEGPAKALGTVNQNVIKPSIQMVLVSVLLNSFQFLLDRLAYEAAVAIASLGAGETPLIVQKEGQDLWADIGMDVAGEFVGGLSDMSTDFVGFNLCAPPNPLVRMSIQLGIKQAYQPPEPKCDILKVGQNWEGFINSAIQLSDNPGDAIIEEFAKSLKPGRNELSASVEIMLEAEHRIDLAKATGFQQALAGDGFKSVTDFVTGQVTTPSSVLQKQFEKTTIEDRDKAAAFHMQTLITNPDYLWAMLFNTMSIFTNTLLSESLNRIYTGMFEASPEIDPFNVEYISNNNRQSAIDRFSSYSSTQPTSITNYNIIAEFVTCPSGGVAIPNINNCVMDANFATAVSRAASKNPMTVQEAIDEGLLHGDWPLVSPDDRTKNENSLCYTFGYCYGNLVKLRKARIIPVGWELAAKRSQQGAPATLQEVVDGFDHCNSQGTIDSSSNRFCHLIDPNWVLKYPETQCRAFVSGEQIISGYSSGRANTCVDMPSCISENNDGSCDGGFGYCVREKNIWRFRGDECPVQYASCLKFTNADTKSQKSLLVNTVDFGVCGQGNAGCLWYRTNKYIDDKGNTDPSDDTYEFLPAGVSYMTVARDAAVEYAGSTRTFDYYAHEDRIYFDRDAEECASQDAGCTKLYKIADNLVLNAVANGSFEQDENNDGVPDGWIGLEATDRESDTDEVQTGEYALHIHNEPNVFSQSGIQLAPNTFYTFSLYAKQGSAGATAANAKIRIYDAFGGLIDLTGLSTTCTVQSNYFRLELLNLNNDYSRYECSFTTPGTTAAASLEIDPFNRARFDAIQIEKGAVASNFADGYNREGATAYLKLAPDYLGCEGKATDPQACEQYTQVCTEQEVGCNLYTPKGGGPAIPAIISAVDACPAECVGYAAFKQEATKYELAFFPEYFIADTAASCTAEQVGCDSFTNLDALDQGGEGIEYYSDLRACLTPADAGDNTGADRAANYFTWEGTDQAGYQLRSWWLLQSNLSDAPCSNWTMSGASSLICNDSGSGLAACDSHDDLVNNPDCREFFDENGVRHYREYSKTVTISEDCHPYRKTIALRDDCLASDGYYTPAGECRYFGVPVESQSCSASAVGCRSYTGGAARNQSVVFDDNLESGTVANYMTENGINIAFSNESLAPDGHSLRVYNASGTEFIATTQAIMTSECATAGGCANQNSEMNGECVIAQGEIDCGPLRDKIAAGKTFNLEFLAKGNGAIKAALIEHGGADDLHYFGEAQLTGAWRLYTLGPLDTSDLDYIDRTTVLGFQTSGATEFFLDNIRLTQAEDNITLIKDSWVTPAACDQTPNGLSSPQYYLGCQEYSDVTNRPNYLYQFSRLCGEDKVGCEAYYQTYNSQSPYGQVNNARCLNGAAPNGSPVGALTACQFNGRTVCSIAPGTNFCLFNLDQAISRPLPAKIVLGPEAKLVSGDRPVYLIDDGSTSCSAANVGCTEIGQPTFNRDKTQVTGFESAYFMNNPDEYENTLCAHKALFCAEWSSTKDGNFYFKDPLDQTCEYKTGITIDRREFFGWFRKGSNEPCDWNDLNQDGAYHPADDSALIKEGGKFEVWRNGDSQYSGWVAQCDQNMDLCTEFLDPTDSQEGRNPLGTSYYFKNNDALSESSLAATQRCDGLVSQKQGCVLFHNSSISDMYYSAEPSYIASERADILFGDAQFAKVDPIDCTNYDPNENRLGKNLCELRCAYRTGGLANPLKTLATTASTADANLLYSGACVDNSDCPSQVAANGLTYAGNCVSVEPAARFTNNTNAIVKVVRDRACAQWLTCESKSVTFDDQQQKWVEVCENLELCSRYTREGDTTECTAADQPEPYVLDALYYAARDVTWTGVEYSGYSIPDQLPVDLYDQVDLNPSKWCVSTASGRPYRDEQTDLGVPCTSDDGCDYLAAAGDYYCSPANEQYYVLANVAGPCTEDYNTACTVGFCEDHPNIACGNSSHCPDNGEICVVGYCQDVYLAIGCDTNTQCNGVSGGRNICDPVARKCVNQLTTGENATACRSAGDCTGINPTCTPSALSRVGTCFNQQCLLDIKGQPYSAKQDKVINPECRGYPEIDSPFSGIPGTVVTKYTTKPPPTDFLPQAQEKKVGYGQVNICAPIQTAAGVWAYTSDCLCSYEKMTYGDGIKTFYYPKGTDLDNLEGVCVGGQFDSYTCAKDSECGCARDSSCEGNEISLGICALPKKKETYQGWTGHCIERDSSTHIYVEQEKNACLTWLPVDRLTGATDLYGKDLEAGQFINQDVFYCSETGYYMDLYPTGTVFDDYSNIVGIDYACASSIDAPGNFQCEQGERDSCEKNAYCPAGWVALVGVCHGSSKTETSLGYCTADVLNENSDLRTKMPIQAADLALPPLAPNLNDCPYFCVPKNSYHSEGNDVGTACFGSGQLSTTNVDGTSVFATPYYLNDNLGVANGESFASSTGAFKKYSDCVVRGVPVGTSEYETDWYYNSSFEDENSGWYKGYGWKRNTDLSPGEIAVDFGLGHAAYGILHRAVGAGYKHCESLGQACTTDAQCLGNYSTAFGPGGIPSSLTGATLLAFEAFLNQVAPFVGQCGTYGGPETTSGSIRPYYGCYELTQVSQEVTTGAALAESNKAWTNRLWQSADPLYQTKTNMPQWTGSATQPLEYTVLDAPAPAGQALFADYFQRDGLTNRYLMRDFADAFPLPVRTDLGGFAIGTVGLDIKAGITDAEAYKYPSLNQYKTGASSTALKSGHTPYSLALSYEDLGNGSELSAVSGDIALDQYGRFGNSNSTEVGVSPDPDGQQSVRRLLSQFFAKTYAVYQYVWNDNRGTYVKQPDAAGEQYESMDISSQGDALGTEFNQYSGNGGQVPVVKSVGSCQNGLCAEGTSGTMSVNGIDDEDIVMNGYQTFQATLSFFTYAQPNQLPIRQIIVDWGNGTEEGSMDTWTNWPLTSHSGSSAADNYYKNHRGTDGYGGEVWCDEGRMGFGGSGEACESSYLTFVNSYRCTPTILTELDTAGRVCRFLTLPNGERRLEYSPCIDQGLQACGFQPRVYVKDNWGWCTGYCTSNPDETPLDGIDNPPDSTNQCYGSECDFVSCPSTGLGGTPTSDVCPDGEFSGIDDPWIYFDGVIKIQP